MQLCNGVVFKYSVKVIAKLQLETVVVCATLSIISDIFRKFNYSPSKMFIPYYNQVLFKLFPPKFTNGMCYITTICFVIVTVSFTISFNYNSV